MALPMATVATGTPRGICTIESSESFPDNALDCTGKPMTGSGVSAATMPGRWAAPPAPAITTFRPRVCAFSAYSYMRFGVRWADTTDISNGTLQGGVAWWACGDRDERWG